MSDLIQRYESFKKEVEAFCLKEKTQAPSLLVVSKKHPSPKIRELYVHGHRDFAENYVQEWREKFDDTDDLDISWHFIGSLQTNKVKYLVGKVEMIHTVDSERLLSEINKRALSQSVKQKILLQIDWEEREDRGGMSETEIHKIAKSISEYPGVELCGLMMVAPLEEEARLYFEKCQKLFFEIKDLLDGKHSTFEHLSMGMSSDYQDAIRFGSSLLRIGTAIMGKRPEN